MPGPAAAEALDVAVYFTYPQPSAYLAWHLLRKHADRFPGIRFVWTPVLYRRLMALQGADAGGSPPLALKYMYADAARTAGALGIPFAAPHRRDPVDQTAHKVHLLAGDAGGDWQKQWMAAMHLATRRDGLDPTHGAGVVALARLLGVPGLERLADPSLDARLEANTQAALRDEACGVPFLRFRGGGFLGHESLGWLAARVAGHDRPALLD